MTAGADAGESGTDDENVDVLARQRSTYAEGCLPCLRGVGAGVPVGRSIGRGGYGAWRGRRGCAGACFC